MGTLLVCSLVLVPLQGYIAKKRGKHFPLIVGMPVWILASISFVFINTETHTWSMLTDVFDVDELITGQRREGIYSGFTTFTRKFASGVAVMLLGVGLKAMGFDQNEYNLLKSTENNFDPSVYASSNIVKGIRLMFVIIPIVLLLITFIFALRYKLNNKRFDSLVKGITVMKEGGAIDTLSEEECRDIEVCTGKPVDKLWGKS
jgi:oligogalacturonide transporter